MKTVVPTLSLLASFLFAAFAFAAAEKSPPAFAQPIELEDGDRFVFLGDSITHQCLYTQYVETYFYTRYPERRIHFRNAGVSGDVASDALLRFDEDVADFEPDYVSVLLGMNDGRYRHFEHEVFARYEQGMEALLGRIGTRAEAIPMGPSYFDTRAVRMSEQAARWVKTREAMRDYYPSVLAFYSEWLAEQAQLAGVNFVDMATPMRRLSFEQRRVDPSFTFAKDAVHPEPKGHVVMAAAMLADAFQIEPVSEISLTLDRKGRIESSSASGKLENLVAKKGRIRFDYTSSGLPWVLPHAAHEGYELAKAGERFSQDLLRVVGLKAGVYELKIDLVPIARFTAGELEVGVDLQGYSQAPQYKQAMEVALLNKDRNEQAIKPLRDQWLHRKSRLRKEEAWLTENPEHPDFESRKSRFDADMQAFYRKLEELEALALEFEDKIYEANQVPARSYVLSPAE
ncbi:SGNH/GDSL hydrolase family protein [Pelagicoccus sp. SDUM812005]|uniref:SGNH/GDSL hydrolase family protein n=1 Tax=Pelagicoccus sp. SDUM812005 TaxID=3041257 RepID=UPI00280D5060|nr:SGNH/GDSL hydrolase family protein [Pelagicoccus sp. SDUM812005]MDQ8180613.1 SGNH/GDSL hydrolase family protein [Pelagicoccus sp. SDUM812005]